MAELNLKQIIDRLNTEFTGDNRKLVFWYDDKGEFAEDMDSVVLENAKVYRLEPDNQFYTKRFLEREDTSTNYLIYAPFPKPDVKDNLNQRDEEKEVPVLGTAGTSTKRYVLGKASFYSFCERHNLIVLLVNRIIGVFGVLKSFRPGRFLLGRFP